MHINCIKQLNINLLLNSGISSIENHIVPYQKIRLRLQEYGVGIFSTILTKSALKKAIKKKRITVNNTIATTATFIEGGETIQLLAQQINTSKEKLKLPLKIIFEDEYLAVIHKPAGILVSGNKFKTIANALPQNSTPSNLADATTPQPVHRLDFETTGILLVGKTNSSIHALNKIFENKAIIKTYYAITIGHMNPQGKIDLNIDTKKAKSNYKLIATIPSKRFGALNLVTLQPKTGRRHQLRIHLSSIKNPILGDKLYGNKELILNGKGLYLHAYSLQFKHPFTNEILCFRDSNITRFTTIFPDYNFNRFEKQ